MKTNLAPLGGVRVLSEGIHINSREAHLVSAAFALQEFVGERGGQALSEADSAWLGALMREWLRCLRALEGSPEDRLRYLRHVAQPKVEDAMREGFAREARRAVKRFARPKDSGPIL